MCGLLERPAIASVRKSDDSSVEICCGTAEEFPAFKLLAEVVDERVRSAGYLAGGRVGRLTVMRLEDLELLEPTLNGARFLELLKQRNSDERLRHLSFKNFILETMGPTLPRNEWIHKEYERLGTRIRRRLFGPSAGSVKVE